MPETFTREISLPLALEEVAESAKALARKHQEMREKERIAKDAAAGARAEIKEMKGEIDALADEVAFAKTTRKVECFERPDERRFCVEIVRADTNEVIDTRPMEVDEREAAMQPRLPGVPPEPNAEDKAPGWDDVAKASAAHGDAPAKKKGKGRSGAAAH